MPAAASSPIPAVLVKLGPLDSGRIADLCPYFDSVPDPRARRVRWYSLTAILLVCACAAVSGARSIDELAEWGQRASTALLTAIGIRRHLLRWRRTPAPATIGRVLGAVDGDALDRAVGAYLADRHRTRPGFVALRVRAVACDRCRRQGTQGISPSHRDAPTSALRGHPRHRRDPCPGRNRRKDERNHTLLSTAGPDRHRRHLRRPALGQVETSPGWSRPRRPTTSP